MKYDNTTKNRYTLADTCRTCENDFAFHNYKYCRDCAEPVCNTCYKDGVGRCLDCQEIFVSQLSRALKNDEGYQAIAKITDKIFILEQEGGIVTIETPKQDEKCGTCGVNPRDVLNGDCVDCYTPGEPEDLQRNWGNLNCPPGNNSKSREFESSFLQAELCQIYSDYDNDPTGGIEI